MEPLSYERLDPDRSEIRLLRIRKGEDGGIRCDLTKHALTSNPAYFALSYVWGDPKVTTNITVDGRRFAATTNLVAALEILIEVFVEQVEENWVFWIDAICINQDDVQERNDQVKLMGEIFRKARLVFAWLGPENDRSTEAIEIMAHIAEEMRSATKGDTSFLSEPAPPSLIHKLNLGSPEDLQREVTNDSLASLVIARAKDLRHLFTRRPFWKRAWILQELVFAEQVLFFCGAAALTYEDILVIYLWFDSKLPAPCPSTVSEIDWHVFILFLESAFSAPARTYVLRRTLDEILASERPYLKAWSILKYSHDLVASDPRDKIYSLLGIIRLGIEPDYSKTAETLYLEVAHNILPQVPLHEWFDKSVPFTSRMPGLPTWVVDWDSRSKENGWRISLRGNLYNAAVAMNDLLHQVEINGSSLLLHGTIFDEVHLLAPCSDDGSLNSANAFQFDVTGGQLNGEVLRSSIPPGFPRGEASLRLCIGDRDLHNGKRYVVSSTYLDMSRSFLSFMPPLDATTREPQTRPSMYIADTDKFIELFCDETTIKLADEDKFTEVIEGKEQVIQMSGSQRSELVFRFVKHFRNTRHFYTRKGFLGYGPKWIQEGDLVCVLQNCRVPVLLRRVDNHYHFISTCFVLGVMDGEAVEMVKRGEICMQQFDIR
jgi:hypothetical protein